MIARLLPLLRQSLLREAMPPLSLGQIHVFPKTLKKCLNNCCSQTETQRNTSPYRL